MFNKNLLNIIVFASLFFVLFSNFGMAYDWSNCQLNCSDASCVNDNNTESVYICLNDTLTSGVTIAASHQTLDCMGNYITGVGGNAVSQSMSLTNITIKNCIINNSGTGVYIANSNTFITIQNNTIANGTNGINYQGSNNNILIHNNTMVGLSNKAIYIYAASEGEGDGTHSNTVSNNTIYLNNYGVALYNTYNNIIENNTIYNSSAGDGYGLKIENSYNNTIENSSFYNNSYGVFLDDSYDNNFNGVSIFNNSDYDVYIKPSSNTTYCNNTFTNVNGTGLNPIELYYQDNQNIGNMTVSEILICGADNSNFTNITVLGNSDARRGLFILNSNNTRFSNLNVSNTLSHISYSNSFLNISNSNFSLDIFGNVLYVNDTSNSSFYNNNIYKSGTVVGAGVQMYRSNNNTFFGNIVHNLINGFQILTSSNNNTFTNNTVYNTSQSGFTQTSVDDNNFYNNTVYEVGVGLSSSAYGFYLSDSDSNVFENNTVYNITKYGFYSYDDSDSNVFENNTVYNITSGKAFYIYGQSAVSDNNTLRYNIIDGMIYSAFYLRSCYNTTVQDNIVRNSLGSVIYMFESNRTNIVNNIITGNLNTSYGHGIHIYKSNLTTVNNNTMYNNTNGVYIEDTSFNSTILSNTIYNTTYGISLLNSLYNNISFNSVYDATRGIFFDRTNQSYIINNTAYDGIYGIYLSGSHNNTIENNTAYNTTYGIYTNPSTNNTITFNTAYNSTIGIGLLSSNNTIVRNNTAYDNTYAVYFNLSRSNTIQNNTARNSNYGVYLLNSTSNTLSGNRAYNNSVSELYSSNSSGNTMSDFTITTLSFLSIDMSGDLSFKEGNLTGVTMPTTYQNISKETLNITNSSSNAWTTINLTYNPSGISDESTIILAHYNGTDWETNTSLYTSNFSINETSNYIYANITDFSMYMIMSPVVAEEVTSTSTGGGGFPSTTYETDLDSVENFVLRISDAVFFPFRGNQHKLRILNMGVGSVYLEVSSDPVKINIASGETKNVDLDSDGTDDISIYLEKIENNKAYITVTAIDTGESDDVVLTDETIEDVKEELDISEDDIEIIKQTDDTIELVIDIGDKEFPMIYGIVALLVVIAAAGWYVYSSGIIKKKF